MKRRLLITALSYIVTSAFNQNLVPNSSFENNSGCPDSETSIDIVEDWWSPFGSPFYFHECNNYQTAYRRVVPPSEKNYNLVPVEPQSGKAYVGIYLANITDHSVPQDYLMSELSSPLEKDKVYFVSMYVRLGDVWKYADNIGVYFSKEKYKVSKRQLIELNPNYQYYTDRVSLIFKKDTCLLRSRQQKLNSRRNWIRIEGKYKAKGGEKYITIGNFHLGWRGISANNIAPETKRENFDYFYYYSTFYYIDNVSVSSIKIDSQEEAYQKFAESIKVGEKIRLDNIYFNTGKSTLKEASFPTLKLLLKYMQNNEAFSLKIHGHTDNVGKAELNQKLSKERALSIQNFLVKNGISKSRISSTGFGSRKPIADNNTEQGRQQNRRVEFIIY